MKSDVDGVFARLKETVDAMATVSPRDVVRLANYAKNEAGQAHFWEVVEAASVVELEASKTEVTLQPSIRHLSEALARAHGED
jgi:hypothetical protein